MSISSVSQQHSKHIVTELNDAVLSIRIQRPDKKNALTTDMYSALTAALHELDNNPNARAGYITGTQDCFTAGNDLSDFLKEPPAPGSNPPVFQFIKALPKLQKPLVAAVNGPAVGVGTTMLLHCDLVYAADSSKFQLPFSSLGACPEAGSSLLLPALFGYQKAAELLLLCDFFTAEDAKSLGLVNAVFSSQDYQQKAYEKAKQLAKQPASSMRTTKMLLKKAQQESLDKIMDLEIEHFANMIQSPEAKEALSAFAEKRQPDFSQFD